LRSPSLVFTIAFLLLHLTSYADDKITYQDHILPLVEANCSKCHNPDKKKADLDLTSYQGALKGSGSGPVVVSGNLDGSKLWKAVTHAEEPNMPPNRPKLDDKDLDLFKKWILGGLLETANGKAVVATAPTVDLTLKADGIGKPDGPPPMPGELPLIPVVHTAHLNAITGLASSPWAPLIAVAGQKQILLFNTESRDLLGILPFTEGQPVDVKFSRSGQLLLANGGRGVRSGRVVLWDVLTGKQHTILGNEYDTILTADIRPDQSQVAVGSPSRLVKIFSTKTGELQHKIKKHTDWVTAVAFSPNGQMLATADRNGGISLWDPDNAQELFTLAGHKSAVTALSWRGDSKLLASSSEDSTVKLWEMQEGKQFKSWNAHGSGALCINYGHDGRLVTCGRDNNVTLWDANGGKIRSITSTNELPLRVAFSHDDSTVFASDFSGHITAYSTKEGKLLGELDANPVAPPEKGAPAKRVASSH
jgi:WD40 repeat protein